MFLIHKPNNHGTISFEKMKNFDIVIIASNGTEIEEKGKNNLLNTLSVSILQCKLFLAKNDIMNDTPNIYVYENDLRVVTTIDNIEYSFL